MRDALIRRAVPADAARLTAIAHAAKRHWGYTDELIELWRDDLTVTASTIDEDLVHCAVDGARIAGFYALSCAEPEFALEHMWVDPPDMGGGLGAALLRHALATVRAHGGTSLRIVSDPNAEGFYRRMGAERIGEEPSAPAGRTLSLLVFPMSADDR